METVWTPELTQQLSALWQEGFSTAEIGRRLGISKNAVVGKAHRLFLTPRPSPVKRAPVKVVEFAGPTCSWPYGHPGEKTFHFCSERPMAGKPYCAEHAAQAYIKPKSQNSNAA